MIKIENAEVFGFEAAIRGARNPMNSWGKSDSDYKYWCSSLGPYEEPHYCNICGYDNCNPYEGEREYVIGPNDLDLLKRLSAAGPDHGKFMRMIHVQADVTAPLYWWKEYDTYKVGTVANSCSTMHKIHSKEFSIEDFSVDHLDDGGRALYEFIIDYLNASRDAFLASGKKDKQFWWNMIQTLPTSYNQLRTIDLNYAVLKNIYHARKEHKLDEWHVFCDWIENLPYAKELICD